MMSYILFDSWGVVLIPIAVAAVSLECVAVVWRHHARTFQQMSTRAILFSLAVALYVSWRGVYLHVTTSSIWDQRPPHDLCETEWLRIVAFDLGQALSPSVVWIALVGFWAVVGFTTRLVLMLARRRAGTADTDRKTGGVS